MGRRDGNIGMEGCANRPRRDSRFINPVRGSREGGYGYRLGTMFLSCVTPSPPGLNGGAQ